MVSLHHISTCAYDTTNMLYDACSCCTNRLCSSHWSPRCLIPAKSCFFRHDLTTVHLHQVSAVVQPCFHIQDQPVFCVFLNASLFNINLLLVLSQRHHTVSPLTALPNEYKMSLSLAPFDGPTSRLIFFVSRLTNYYPGSAIWARVGNNELAFAVRLSGGHIDSP